ncbi:chemotaxis protein CheC [Candidatus Magnetoovum chiemensis]|nr:chemotaxis protein CheC [Candidatus Magnetoovum chiemensis]
MDNEDDRNLTSLEIDTMQEIMNIAFGQAAADLAEIIDLYVVLSVPDVNFIKGEDLNDYINCEMEDFKTCHIVEQSYSGKTKGVALLLFPHGAENTLLTLFKSDLSKSLGYASHGELEKEVLMEIGNILIGACVSKIAELLNDSITFQPPRITTGESFCYSFLHKMFSRDDWAILFRTVFNFEKRDVAGYLFLINSQVSISYIKKALNDFWQRYE